MAYQEFTGQLDDEGDKGWKAFDGELDSVKLEKEESFFSKVGGFFSDAAKRAEGNLPTFTGGVLAAPEKAQYKSVLEGRQMDPPRFDAAEAERMSRREYVERKDRTAKAGQFLSPTNTRAPTSAQKYAEENPILSSIKSSAANALAGTINAPASAAQAANEMVGDTMRGFGMDIPKTRVPNLPLVDGLMQMSGEYTSALQKRSPGEAWDNNEFGGWLMTQLGGSSMSSMQSLGALMVPGLQATLLTSMGAQVAGASYAQGDSGVGSVLKGGVEALSEMLPLKAAEKIKDLVVAIPLSSRAGVLEMAGRRVLAAGGAITSNSLVGAIEESAAQIGGNAIDILVDGKAKSLFEDVDRAAIVGAAANTSLAAPAIVKTLSRAAPTRGQLEADAARTDALDSWSRYRVGPQPDLLATQAPDPIQKTVAAAQANAASEQAVADIGAATTVDEAIATTQASVNMKQRAVELDNDVLLDGALAAANIPEGDLKAELSSALPLDAGVPTDLGQTLQAPTSDQATQVLPTANEAAVAPPAQATTAVWTGRRGNGYATLEDAQKAQEERSKTKPMYSWTAQQSADGRFVLNGALKDGASTQRSAAEKTQGVTYESSTRQADDSANAGITADVERLRARLAQSGGEQGQRDAVTLRPATDEAVRELAARSTPERAARLIEASETVRQIGAIAQVAFGSKLQPILGLSDAFGIQDQGVAYASIDGLADYEAGGNSVQAMAVATAGHEVTHNLQKSKNPKDRALYSVFSQAVLAHTSESQIKARTRAEGKDEDYGKKEIVADVGGAYWMDSKFWARLYDIDGGSTMRKVVYKLMENLAKMMEVGGQIAKGSRADAGRFIKGNNKLAGAEIGGKTIDLTQFALAQDAVREVAAQVWAQKAKDGDSLFNGQYDGIGAASRSSTKDDDNDRASQNQRAAADQRDVGGGRSEDRGAAAGQNEAPKRTVSGALAGAPSVPGYNGPDPRVVAVAEQYARDNGIDLKRQSEYAKIDPERAKRIADAYAAMENQPQDPAVKEAYQNLIQQTTAQYKALEKAGYKFWFIDIGSEVGQKYASTPWNAMRDLRASQSMGVFPSEDGFGSSDLDVSANPLLAKTGVMWPMGGPDGKPQRVLANDLFRAVHDAFGHGMEGAGFRAEGEENAWQAHVRLFTGSAVGAITSETRGQNSWVNFGPNSESNKTALAEDTVFADQKVGLMPSWTWTEGRVGDEVTSFESANRIDNNEQQANDAGADTAGPGQASRPGGLRDGAGRPDEVSRSRSGDVSESNLRGGRPQSYGAGIEGATSALGIHFSQQPRQSLNSNFYGSGLKGLEAKRLEGQNDIRPRVFFYVDKGGGVRPEAGVGGVAHQVQLNNLYDAHQDPLGLVKSVRGMGGDSQNNWERAVMKAGFDGYLINDPRLPQNYAVLVGARHTAVPVSRADPKRADGKVNIMPVEKQAEKTRTEGDELVRRPQGAELMQVIQASRAGIEVVAPSFKMKFGEARVLASEASAADSILSQHPGGFAFREAAPSRSKSDNLDDYDYIDDAAFSDMEIDDQLEDGFDEKELLAYLQSELEQSQSKAFAIEGFHLTPTAEKIKDAGIHPEDAFDFKGALQIGSDGEAFFDVPYYASDMVRVSVSGSTGSLSVKVRADDGSTFLNTTSLTDEQIEQYAKRQISGVVLSRQGYDIASPYRGGTVLKIAAGWKKIAAAPGAFKLAKPETKSVSFMDVANEMGAFKEYDVHVSGPMDFETTTFERKSDGKIFTASTNGNDKEIGCCTMGLANSGGLGVEFYSVLGRVAENRGLRFMSDDYVSGVNSYRRTEQAMSYALKTGRTDVLLPGGQNRVYGYDSEAKTQEQHDRNIARLALAGLRNVEELAPDVRRLRYKPESDQFVDSRGKDAEVTVKAMLSDKQARVFGLGRSTIARAVLTGQIIAGEKIDAASFESPIAYSLANAEMDSPIGEAWGGAEGGLEGLNPNLRRFASGSQIVNDDGTPVQMYHGTARDIQAFRPKQAGAVFLTYEPRFAEDFAGLSKDWMRNNWETVLTPAQQEVVKERAIAGIMSDKWVKLSVRKEQRQSILNDTPDEITKDFLTSEAEKLLPSGENIMPVFVRATAPFDFRKDEQVNDLIATLWAGAGLADSQDLTITPVKKGNQENLVSQGGLKTLLSKGAWEYIESPEVQSAIKDVLGHDGFFVTEHGQLNLAVYDPKMVKSVFNNTYDTSTDDISRSKANADAEEVGVEVSARKPEGKRFTGDKHDRELLSDLKAARTDPVYLKKIVTLLAGETGIQGDTQEETLDLNIEFMKRNLLWLHDHAMERSREAYELSTQWYVGGNRIANQYAAQWGVPRSAASGMLAVLSPSMDWFQNVDAAVRLGEFLTNNRSQQWTPGMQAEAERQIAASTAAGKTKEAEKVRSVIGKSVDDFAGEADLMARIFDIYDRSMPDNTFRKISPDGVFGELATNADGGTSSTLKQSIANLAKAVSIYENSAPSNISQRLGEGHKVRNFYNNIESPGSTLGHTTIDTHAVGAAHLLAVSNSHALVGANFSGPSSANIGLSGTYPIYMEAYRRAAEERGIPPRAMQSITWEAVRTMFEKKSSVLRDAKGKSTGVKYSDAIASIWDNWKSGDINEDAARTQVEALTGGVRAPDWYESIVANGPYSQGDVAGQRPHRPGDVSGAGVRSEDAGRAGPRGRGKRPGVSEDLSFSRAERQGFEAGTDGLSRSRVAGPREAKYQENYLVPELEGAFDDDTGNVAYMPAVVFARDGIQRDHKAMPVRIRVGEHVRDGEPLKSQYGLQHRIENKQKQPSSRGYISPGLQGEGTAPEVERATRDIVLGVLTGKTVYADTSPNKIYLHSTEYNRQTVLEKKRDSEGRDFWSVVTSMPSDRDQMMRRYKSPSSVFGLTVNGERTQQALDTQRGILNKLKEPGRPQVTSESYILDEDGLLFEQQQQISSTPVVDTQPKKVLARDENGRIILKRKVSVAADEASEPSRSRRDIDGDNFTLSGETQMQTARRKVQDYFLRVQTVQRAVLGQGGVVNEKTDTYGAEVLSHGRSNALLEDFARNQVQPLMEKAVKMGVELDELSLYAYAMHAKERNAHIAKIDGKLQDGGSGMKNAEADGILQLVKLSGDQAKFEELHGDLMAITMANRLVMLDEGLITQDEFNALEGAYDNYIPLRGFELVDEDNKPTGQSAGKGFNVRGPETLKAKGRISRAGQLIENVIGDHQRTIVRSERNQVAKVFLNFVLTNPDDKLWEVDAVSTRKSIDRQTGRIARNTAIEKGEDTIAVKVKGREIYIKIKDPLLARAMRKAHSDETGEMAKDLMRTVGLYTSLLRNTLTRYNPEFAVVNAARDFGFGATAMLDELGEKGAAKFVAHYAGAVAVSSRNERNKLDPANREWDKWFAEYRAAGGITGGFYQKGVEEIGGDIRDMMVEAGAQTKDWTEAVRYNKVTRAAKGALRVLEYAGSVSENAARVAAFRTAREMGKTPAQAAIIAKNLTTNFDRKGEYGQILNSLYVFFNAAIQGTHRTAKMFMNPKVMAYAGGFTAGMVGLALANALAGGDDPDDGMAYWDKIPDYVKERNLIIMLPAGAQVEGAEEVGTKGRYLTIPVQYGLNLFPVIGYAISDLIRNGQDKSRGKGWAKTGINVASAFAGSFNPFGGAVDLTNGSSVAQAIMPSIFDPVVQFTTGTNGFGREVAPFKSPFDDKPDSQNSNVRQAGGVAESVAQWLNAATGGSSYESGGIDVSAGTLENVVRNLSGGTGVFLYDVLALADKSVESAAGGDPDLFVRDIPILRRVYGETAGDVDQGLFYERRKQIQAARSAEKGADEAGADFSDPEKLALASLNKDAAKYTKWLAQVRKEMKEVQVDKEITKGDRKLKLRELRAERDRLTADFNKDFMEALRDALLAPSTN